MAHGGTNFGFENGAGSGPPYTPGKRSRRSLLKSINDFLNSVTTSYDYDAPISEAGVRTRKFYSFQNVINKHLQAETSQISNEMSVAANYGRVRLSYASSFLAARGTDVVKPSWKTQTATPPTFADLWQASGFVLYETKLVEAFSQPTMLYADDALRDRGYVFLDGKPQVNEHDDER